MNSTVSIVDGHQGQLSAEVLQQIALLSFFMLIALLGNLTVLVYLCKTQTFNRPVSIFVLSLAISDTCIAIFSMSVEILWEAFGQWIFGNFFCKLSTYIQCMLFASTAFILMSMSYDRYEAICKPMAFTRTLSRSRKMVILSWCLALIVAIPQLFIFLQVEEVNQQTAEIKYNCKSAGYTDKWQRKVYVTWLATYVFVIPLIFVAVCYIKIARVVWRSSASSKSTGETKHGLRRNNTVADGTAERAKFKTIKITITILSCYILCWTPYFTVTLLNVWTDYQYKNQIPMEIRTLAKCLAWFSSCVNPIIYLFFNIPLQSIKGLCCCCASSKSTADDKFNRTYSRKSVSGSMPPSCANTFAHRNELRLLTNCSSVSGRSSPCEISSSNQLDRRKSSSIKPLGHVLFDDHVGNKKIVML